MVRIRHSLLLALLIVPCHAVAAADSPAAPVVDEKAVLNSMAKTNTWGHPDLFFEFAGMQAYADGHYRHALYSFKEGALYADKVSQLSVGLMYLQGQGVDKDPVTAYAWLSLAAERGYPQFVATRDAVAAQLTPDQRSKAEAILQTLMPEYGDAVAKRRLAVEMGHSMLAVNPVGKSPMGVYTSTGGNGAADFGYCSSPEHRVLTECGFYANWRWNANDYFAARDALWQPTGTVTVMPLEPVSPPTVAAKPGS
jgi:hypothetical protein